MGKRVDKKSNHAPVSSVSTNNKIQIWKTKMLAILFPYQNCFLFACLLWPLNFKFMQKENANV